MIETRPDEPERNAPGAECGVGHAARGMRHADGSGVGYSALRTPHSALETLRTPQSGVSPLRQPLVDPPRTPGQVTEEIGGLVGRRPGPAWWAALLLCAAAFGVGVSAMVYTMRVGIGTWGVNRTVGWGFDITNFVYWIGIAHAGTLISALLFLFRQRWRTSISRATEAMTVFSVMCAGILPLIHMGRPWYFYWLMPHPNSLGPLWVNFRSPLLWDFFAISTYLIISMVFWYVGLVPDLATLRDRATGTSLGARLQRRVFGLLSLGWNGSARAWHHYEAVYALIALLAPPLVVSVSTIVGCDFATSVIPGWHTTIFPPYFVLGAIYCGFATVLALLVITRKVMRLEAYVTPQHLNWLCKILLMGSVIMGTAYGIEAFTGWYSGNPYEVALFRHRMTGDYAWAYWTMLGANVLAPQILWFRRARRTLWLMVLVGVLINVGMWCERFVIVVTSLYRDFLPSSWTTYLPTANEVATMVGLYGLFFGLFLLFARFLPVIPIAEVKSVLDYARPRLEEENSPQRHGEHGEGRNGRETVGFASVLRASRPLLSSRPLNALRASAVNHQTTVERRYCIGYFAEEGDLLAAAAEARERGYPVLDAFTPYPVHGLPRVLGLGPSPLTWVGFWAGALGLVTGLALQVWISVFDWPLRVGGQPFLAWPVFIPVTFEFIVMFACLISVGALFARTHRWPGRWRPGPRRVTDDRFALALVETDATVDLAAMRRLLRAHGAIEVAEGDELV